MKLGLLPKREDPRTFKMSRFCAQLPDPPDAVDWSSGGTDWGMMLNDSLGDCAIAGPGHLIMARTLAAGKLFIPPDDAILQAYSDVSGYDPATGANDNGCCLLDVMNYWRKTGIAGDKIGAFVEADTLREIKQTVQIFEGSVLGLTLPVSAQGQSVWEDVGDNDGGVWGGHCVLGLVYDPEYLTVVTWGGLMKASWPFIAKYLMESRATIDQDMLSGDTSPSGFDSRGLQEALNELCNS